VKNNIKIMLASPFKLFIISTSKRNNETVLSRYFFLSIEKVFFMKISVKQAFIASTDVPLVKITFDVYADKKHFEIIFNIKDERTKKTIALNLRKAVQMFVLVKSELSEDDYLNFLVRAVVNLDEYQTRFIEQDDGALNGRLSQTDLLRFFMQAVAEYEAKQAKKALKK